jgi:Delta7-sterol 5-desaturase
MDVHEFFEPDLGAYVRYVIGFALRYFAVAGGLFVLLNLWMRRRWLVYRVQPTFPGRGEVGHEVLWSMSNAACTGISTLILYQLVRDGHTRMYFDAGAHGWLYFVATVVLGVVSYDAWFYWQHRLLHTEWLYRHAHAIHHRVTNPTPLATFTSHPIETFMGNVFFLLLPLVVPIHPLAMGLVGLYIFLFGILLHTGYEFFPAGFTRHPVLRWVNTSTHHNMHHGLARSNYGLCFNFWDWLMGTNDVGYHDTFDAIKARLVGTPAPAAALGGYAESPGGSPSRSPSSRSS